MNYSRPRIVIPILLIMVLLVAGSAGLQSSAQSQDASARLYFRAIGNTPLLDDARELCDRIGGRPTGSPACERAIEWGVAAFRAAAVDSVTTETFTVPSLWLARSAVASAISPEAFPLHIAAAPYSASTSLRQPLEARIVDAGDGSSEAFAKLGSRAKDSIAIVRSGEMKSLDDLFLEYLRNDALMEAARKAGVAALFLQSSRPRGLLYRHPVSLNARLVSVPVAVIAREEAARLLRLAERQEVRVRLNLSNQVGGPYQSRNVVAEIRGSEKPDEIVLLGAHLDSWELGTGANDNGINSALVIDVARGIKMLGLHPRRTIRFVLFTGEEQGMWGSAGYVKNHEAELDRHTAVVIFDIGSGRTDGFYLNGREELRREVEDALRLVRGKRVWNNPLDGIDGTDNYDFLLSGVPNLVANQDASPYLPDYHAQSDVFEMIDGREAKTNTGIAAALVWGLANSSSPQLKRQTRIEIDKLLSATKLNEQMKAFGQWEDWVSGNRGIPK